MGGGLDSDDVSYIIFSKDLHLRLKDLHLRLKDGRTCWDAENNFITSFITRSRYN